MLVAAISDAVPRAGLGQALGRYGSMQAAGQAFPPLVGGAAAALDYRLAFAASAVAAGLRPRAASRPGTRTDRLSWRQTP